MAIAAEQAERLIADFCLDIKRHEDLLYGVALFFEGVAYLYSGEEPELETYRKQFRNIIQLGNDALERAVAMVERAKQNPEKAELFTHFTFVPCLGHPHPEALAARAQILVDTYNEIFPGRPRGQAFSQSEIRRLMEAAAVRLPQAEA
ncbi:MAG: hypothetical protein WCL44_01765 [bacterium]